MVECLLMILYVVRLIPLTYFSFQTVFFNWCNKGHSMYHPVCRVVHTKDHLLFSERVVHVLGSSGFPLILSEWSFTMCLMSSLNKTFPSFLPSFIIGLSILNFKIIFNNALSILFTTSYNGMGHLVTKTIIAINFININGYILLPPLPHPLSSSNTLFPPHSSLTSISMRISAAD